MLRLHYDRDNFKRPLEEVIGGTLAAAPSQTRLVNAGFYKGVTRIRNKINRTIAGIFFKEMRTKK